MAPAAVAFAGYLANVDLRSANTAVVCNFTGAVARDADALAQALAGQIANTVRWDDCMDSIAERRVRCTLEVGPGSALVAMRRDRHPEISARSIDDFQGPEGAARWISRQLGLD